MSASSTLSAPAGTPLAEFTYPHIAFIGGMGTGKTTLAEWLVKHFCYYKLSFAAPLKDTAVRLWGTEALKDRTLLQQLGRKMRDIDPDVWLNNLTRWLPEIPGPVVVDDCRFPNEYWGLISHGFVVVRVTAPHDERVMRLLGNGKLQNQDQLYDHTETAISSMKGVYQIDNSSSPEDACNQIMHVLDRERRRT